MINQILIRQIKSGNQGAFNILARKWQIPIYNFCLRYIGDVDTAKDILQMVLLKIYQKIGTLEDHSKFSAWVYRIARNLCLDELKRKKFDALNHESEAVADENTPWQNLDNADISNMLHKALCNIPQEQKEVIILKTYHDLKFTEIAEILGVSINTVKSRMYSGLSALRPHVSNLNPNEE